MQDTQAPRALDIGPPPDFGAPVSSGLVRPKGL